MKNTTNYKDDLDWFFNNAEADLLIKSNYATFIQACKDSYSHQDMDNLYFIDAKSNTSKTMSIEKALAKYNKVFHIYKQLSSKSKIILECHYDTHQNLHPDIIKNFKNLSNLIIYTNFAQYNKLTKYSLIEPTNNQLSNILNNKLQLIKETTNLINSAYSNYRIIKESNA